MELRRSVRQTRLDQRTAFREEAQALHESEVELRKTLDELSVDVEAFADSIAELRSSQGELSIHAQALLRGSKSMRARVRAMLEAEPVVELAAARARAIASLNQSAEACFASSEQAELVRECWDRFDGMARRWELHLGELRKLRANLERSLLPRTPRGALP